MADIRPQLIKQNDADNEDYTHRQPQQLRSVSGQGKRSAGTLTIFRYICLSTNFMAFDRDFQEQFNERNAGRQQKGKGKRF